MFLSGAIYLSSFTVIPDKYKRVTDSSGKTFFIYLYTYMSFNLPKRTKRLRQRDPEEEEERKLAKQTKTNDSAVQGILDRKKQRREMDKELERVGILLEGQIHEINACVSR